MNSSINSNLTPEQKAIYLTNVNNLNESLVFAEKSSGGKSSKIGGIFGVVLAALIVFGVGGYFFTKNSAIVLSPQGNKEPEKKLVEVPMVINPINGEKVPQDKASAWINKRPIGVMVNNHWDARPQSGLYRADLVYEIVAEGGITRFLAFFLSDLPDKIGPVRSTREYYLVLVKELGDAMLMHIGWSPQALEAIETWPVRSLGRGGADFTRDQARIDKGIAIEHTAYVNGSYLRKLGEDLGWNGYKEFESWKFKDTSAIDTTQQCLVGECKFISIDFWTKGEYSANFKYNRATNTYLRYSGYDEKDQPIPLIDQEDKVQVAAKTLVIQFAIESSIPDDEKHRLTYTLVGSGKALVFLDGKVIPGTWTKAERDGRTKFYDQSGNEIPFNRGKIWVSIVPDRNVEQVTY